MRTVLLTFAIGVSLGVAFYFHSNLKNENTSVIQSQSVSTREINHSLVSLIQEEKSKTDPTESISILMNGITSNDLALKKRAIRNIELWGRTIARQSPTRDHFKIPDSFLKVAKKMKNTLPQIYESWIQNNPDSQFSRLLKEIQS